MDFPPLLVSAMTPARNEGALLLCDLNQGTYSVALPYPGAHCTTPDHLYVARDLGEGTRLEKYDRAGLLWLRRVEHCLDTHSVALVGNRLAVCSTGTNEVIFLDQDGVEQSRWSPDEAAEADSWHINSLAVHQERLFTTCFGRFQHFRGWAGHTVGAGLLIEIPSGRPVLQGFTAPHDPRRVKDGWVINDSANSRTLLVSDSGTSEVLVTATGFARGLVVLPQAYVIGLSTARTVERQEGCASILCVDRRNRRVVKTINLPYAEIGHIMLAPSTEVLEALRREQGSLGPCAPAPQAPISERDRAGSVTVVGPPRVAANSAQVVEIRFRLTNNGRAVWSSSGDLPVHVAYRLVAADGHVVLPEGPRTPLPVPVLPGRSLTLSLAIDRALYQHLPAVAGWITVVQETVAWWQRSDVWTPALVRLPLTGSFRPPAQALLHGPDAGGCAGEELARACDRTADAGAALTRLEELGPVALGLARRFHNLSLRYPRLSSTAKRLLRSYGASVVPHEDPAASSPRQKRAVPG